MKYSKDNFASTRAYQTMYAKHANAFLLELIAEGDEFEFCKPLPIKLNKREIKICSVINNMGCLYAHYTNSDEEDIINFDILEPYYIGYQAYRAIVEALDYSELWDETITINKGKYYKIYTSGSRTSPIFAGYVGNDLFEKYKSFDSVKVGEYPVNDHAFITIISADSNKILFSLTVTNEPKLYIDDRNFVINALKSSKALDNCQTKNY